MSDDMRERCADFLDEMVTQENPSRRGDIDRLVAFVRELVGEMNAGKTKDPAYYWPDGHLKWGHPVDVGHLILQLQTLDPKMKVSSVVFIGERDRKKARAFGLSMSRERWDESGWLDYKLNLPDCLAIWATCRDSEQEWTEKPTTPGWYWYRHQKWDDLEPVMVQVVIIPQTGELTILWRFTNQPVKDYAGNGQWCGPLTEPGQIIARPEGQKGA